MVPILECVRSLPSGFAAQLGYDNTSGATQSLVVGANNGFGLPEPEDDLGQPISFAAGRQRNVFQVPFTTSISYTLGQTTVTATSGSVRCGASQPPPRETFEFHYPQGVALESIVLGQEEALLLQSDARVLPTSAGVFVTAFGNADIRARAQLGSLVAKAQVTVARYSTLAGSLRSEVKPSVSPYATVKGGISLGPVTPRSLNFGIEKRLGGSSGYIGVPKNGRLTLPPGSYGSLEVFDNAELTLQSGRYHFGYFRVSPLGKVSVTPGGGSTTLIVDHVLKSRGTVSQPDGPKGRLLVLVGSTSDAGELVIGGQFSGMAVAPYTDVQVLANARITGGILSNSLNVGPSATITQRPFEWVGILGLRRDTDGDGTVDPEDACVLDPKKTDPLLCGCAKAETDTDGDGVPDCLDSCPHDANNTSAGPCGCADQQNLQRAGKSCVVEACSGSRQEATCNAQGQCGAPNCAPLPGGSCTYKVFRDSLYWFCNGAKTWDDANSLCNAEPGRSLIKIDDRIEDLWLSSVAALPAWLGGNTKANPEEWRWAAHGEPSGKPFWVQGLPIPGRFTKWAPERPQFESCLAIMADGTWSDQPCTSTGQRSFVCEQPIRNLPATLPPLDKCNFYPGIPCGQTSALPAESTCVEESTAFPELPPNAAEAEKALALAAVHNKAALCFANCKIGTEPGCSDCSGFATPPSILEQCDPFSKEQQALCDLVSVHPTATCTLATPTCPIGFTCGRTYECAALDASFKTKRCSSATECALGQSCSSRLGVCIDPTKHSQCDFKQGEKCVGICSGRFACGQPEPGCAGVDDGANLFQCSDTLVCSHLPPPVNTDPRTDPNSNLTAQVFPPDTFFPRPVEKPSEYTSAKPPGCGGTGEPACSFPVGEHPWCKYKVDPSEAPGVRNVSDAAPAFGDKKGSSGRLGPISFDFDPNLELNYDISEPLSLGDAKFKVKAQASATATVGFKLLGVGGDVTLIDALARLEMDRCGLAADAHLILLGKDFLPSLMGNNARLLDDLDTSAAARARCEEGIQKVSQLVNRAQKALRDTQELIRQEKELVGNGRRFAGDFCQKVIGDGKALPPDFPTADAPFTGCGLLSPEDTINLFVRYYEQEVGKLIAGQSALLTDSVPSLPGLEIPFLEGGTNGPGNRRESNQVANVSFFIGPIPMNLTIDVFIEYGLNGAFTFALTPKALLTAYQSNTQEPIAKVDVSLTPTASSGVTLFLGAGFDFGAVSAKVGLSGTVALGRLEIPLYAGAGIGVQSEVDARPLPSDLTGMIPSADLIFPPGVPKKYRLDAFYKVGASVGIHEILHGELAAKVRVKFAFFSKTWSKRIVKFDAGIPDINIPLITAEHDLWSPEADFSALGSIRMPIPFIKFTELETPPPLPPLPPPPPPPPGSGGAGNSGGSTGSGGATSSGGAATASGGRPPVSLQVSGDPRYANLDSSRVGQLFYDGYCECSQAGQGCKAANDCCGTSNLCVLDDSLSTPASVCAACVPRLAPGAAKGQQCNTDSDCCQGDQRWNRCYPAAAGGPSYCQACRGQDEPLVDPNGTGAECCVYLHPFRGPGAEATRPVCSAGRGRTLGQSCKDVTDCAGVFGETVDCSADQVCIIKPPIILK